MKYNNIDEKAIKWKMKYQAMRTATNYNNKTAETSAKSIPRTHKYMTAHSHDLVQALGKTGGVIVVLWAPNNTLSDNNIPSVGN